MFLYLVQQSYLEDAGVDENSELLNIHDFLDIEGVKYNLILTEYMDIGFLQVSDFALDRFKIEKNRLGKIGVDIRFYSAPVSRIKELLIINALTIFIKDNVYLFLRS